MSGKKAISCLGGSDEGVGNFIFAVDEKGLDRGGTVFDLM